MEVGRHPAGRIAVKFDFAYSTEDCLFVGASIIFRLIYEEKNFSFINRIISFIRLNEEIAAVHNVRCCF